METEYVIFNEIGHPISRVAPPPSSHVLMSAGVPFRDPDGRWLAPDGSYRWMLMGHECFAGLDGRTAARVPIDVALVGKSWDDLAAITSVEHPFGYLPLPRPETPEEATARAAAEANAAAEAEAERVGNLEVERWAALLALLSGGITEAQIASAIDGIADATERERSRIYFGRPRWRRNSDFIAWGKTQFALTDVQIDALFVAADAMD